MTAPMNLSSARQHDVIPVPALGPLSRAGWRRWGVDRRADRRRYWDHPSLSGLGRMRYTGFLSGLGEQATWGDVAVQASRAGAQAASGNMVQSLASITGATITTASALGAGWATAAIPVIGPIVAGVTVGLSMLFARKGPRQKVATTEIVNKVEPLLVENLNGYMSGPRTRSSQAQALANFDAAWQYVVEHCAIPEMGNPGQACVSDRQAGACKWRDERGECWNWFVGYRDPIANDPNVKDDQEVSGGSVMDGTGTAFQVVGSGLDSKVVIGGVTLDSKILLGAGLILAGLLMTGSGRREYR